MLTYNSIPGMEKCNFWLSTHVMQKEHVSGDIGMTKFIPYIHSNPILANSSKKISNKMKQNKKV